MDSLYPYKFPYRNRFPRFIQNIFCRDNVTHLLFLTRQNYRKDLVRCPQLTNVIPVQRCFKGVVQCHRLHIIQQQPVGINPEQYLVFKRRIRYPRSRPLFLHPGYNARHHFNGRHFLFLHKAYFSHERNFRG